MKIPKHLWVNNITNGGQEEKKMVLKFFLVNKSIRRRIFYIFFFPFKLLCKTKTACGFSFFFS